jgi:hypothetical protein
MLPEAKKDDLLYVTDAGYHDAVYVLSYPQGKLVGTIYGLELPLGECVDRQGAVWIVTSGPSQLVKFAHGATSSSATLYNDDEEAISCAVDPQSGDLAVANETPATLGVFKNASGTATYYSDSDIRSFFFCAYDNQGNLYGTSPYVDHPLAELPKGSEEMVTIAYPKAVALGGLDWDGTDLAINEIYGNGIGPLTVNRVQVSGSSATIVSSVRLSGRKKDRNDHEAAGFDVHGNRIFGLSHEALVGYNIVSVWRYPAGGRTISHFSVPYGAVVFAVVLSPKAH